MAAHASRPKKNPTSESWMTKIEARGDPGLQETDDFNEILDIRMWALYWGYIYPLYTPYMKKRASLFHNYTELSKGCIVPSMEYVLVVDSGYKVPPPVPSCF